MTHEGQKYVEPLQYAPLPRAAVEKAEKIIGSMTFKDKFIQTLDKK
jgi:hypothetical protein